MDEGQEFRGGLRWGRNGVSMPFASLRVTPHFLTIGLARSVSVSIPRAPEVHVNKSEVANVELRRRWWRISHEVQIVGHNEPAPVRFTTYRPRPIQDALREFGWPVA